MNKDAHMSILRCGMVVLGLFSAGSWAQTCGPAGEVGVRIDYEAAIPSATIPMAPFGEVARNFPQARGITERTVYIGPDRMVDVRRGIGIKATVSKNIEIPAPGVHFRDQSGQPITFVGYQQVPLTFIKILTRTDRVSYNSLTGEARRSDIRDRDPDTLAALMTFEDGSPVLGEREYAGVRCTAKRVPAFGPRSETCVQRFHDWPVALYLQFDMPEAGGLQWYRAVRVERNACIASRDVSLPPGVRIVERGQRRARSSQ
jgi:hypothetical protein